MSGDLTTRQGGPCNGFEKKCINGTSQDDYSAYPNFEWVESSCDLEDNDCDGITDNISGPRPLTTLQDGVCAGTQRICVTGNWTDNYSSVPNYEVVELSCDGLDNDCDGQTDEGLSGIPASRNQGLCVGLLKQCINGTWVDPDFFAIIGFELIEVSCDGLDNDCDGQTDENIIGVNMTQNQNGVCRGTYQWCSNGTFVDDYTRQSNFFLKNNNKTYSCLRI
jgi:hypothetical protein